MTVERGGSIEARAFRGLLFFPPFFHGFLTMNLTALWLGFLGSEDGPLAFLFSRRMSFRRTVQDAGCCL